MLPIFRNAVESGDIDSALDLLHPDVVFHSPAVFTPYEGRAATEKVLRAVLEVFEDFTYTDELHGGSSHGLVFTARVGDKQLQGWDYILTDETGRITGLTVMVRPLKALLALVEAMAEKLR